MSSRSRRTSAAIAALSLAAVLSLSSCGTGQNWVDEGTKPSGNGQFVTVGPVSAQNLTLVSGEAGPKAMTLIGVLQNTGESPDKLVSASIASGATKVDGVISGGGVPLPSRAPSPVSLGFDSTNSVDFFGADAQLSHYVPVTLRFESAGEVTVPVLVVPPVGQYEGIAPQPQSR